MDALTMVSTHVRLRLTAGLPYVGQTCPIRRVIFKPDDEVVLCQQTDNVISLSGWLDCIQADWNGICQFCNSSAPTVPPPQWPIAYPIERRSIPPSVRSSPERFTQSGSSIVQVTRPMPPTSTRPSNYRSTTPTMVILVILLVFGFAVGSLFFIGVFKDNTPGQKAIQEPYSFFVSAIQNLQVKANQQLLLESRHMSRDKLDALEIFINDQPVRTEGLVGQYSVFPEELVTLQVSVNGQPVQVSPFKAEVSLAAWEVSIIWTGHIPGTYSLSMVVTDKAGRRSPPLIQQIEVK